MDSYLKADRICDVVMKGGITSGIVFPPALDHIAQRFWLAGIGGTSAGAIAAALAAAAEYRRRNGSGAGYDLLRETPKQFGDPKNLLALFNCDASTKQLYNLFLNALKPGCCAKLRVACRALPVLAFGSPLQKLADNFFGLCSGMANGNRSTSEALPPLTDWLSQHIDRLAGMPSGRPLTFGDLWHAPPPPFVSRAVTGERSIRLQTVSTCLTFGRPYTLPYLDRRWAFSVKEFGKLFPKYVVDYLQTTALAIKLANPPGDGLLPLPVEDKMPVIVAARMSLSFPGLFSAVPLHYPNYHVKGAPFERTWFSDGGITSNMPIQFFDGPAPRWPTLAINLQYTRKPGEYGRSRVDANGTWMARNNVDGRLELFNQFDAAKGPADKLVGFVSAIFRAAQVWHDNSFLVLPGYCGRVVEIWLDPNEGGLNLAMPPEVVSRLIVKGDAAGRRLVERFADPASQDEMGWPAHRWSRFRSTTAAMAVYLRRFKNGMTEPMPGDRALMDVLRSSEPPPCYRFGPHESATTEEQRHALSQAAEAQRNDCVEATAGLLKVADGLDACPPPPSKPDESAARPFWGGPRPMVDLAVSAPQASPEEASPPGAKT